MLGQLEVINFTRGVPPLDVYPLADIHAAYTRALERKGAKLLGYNSPYGYELLRALIASWFGANFDQVIVTPSSLMAIRLACKVVRSRAGAFRAAAEEPTYDRALTILAEESAGIVTAPLKPPEGPDISFLEFVVQGQKTQRPVMLFYAQPDFQNPAGTTWDYAKRNHVLKFTAEYDILVVEDSPYRHLWYYEEPMIPLVRLAKRPNVLHVSSFSKLLAPGPRVGFAVGPSDLIAEMGAEAQRMYNCPDFLAQAAVYEWCISGKLEEHKEMLRRKYLKKLDVCLAEIYVHLRDCELLAIPRGGFFVSLYLADGIPAARVREEAAKLNLVIAPGEPFFHQHALGERFVRLPFCSLSLEQIEGGIRRLATAIRQVREAVVV